MAEEGVGGRVITSTVSKYERTTERGIKVCIFDTPGLGGADVSDKEIIAIMEKETESKLDIALYCISLASASRVQHGDIHALKTLTRAFTTNFWKKAIFVLTYANILADMIQNADNYLKVVEHIKNQIKQVLRQLNVSEEVISQLPIVTTGYTNPILKYEEDKSPEVWDDRLLLEMLKRVDPHQACVPFKQDTCGLM